MTFDSIEQIKTLQASTTPYQISIENVGDNLPSQNTHIDFGLLN